MCDFRLMDRVYFHHGGEHITGTVVRINQRTLSVLTDTGRRWTVAHKLLRHEEDSPASNEPTRVHVVNIAPSYPPHVTK